VSTLSGVFDRIDDRTLEILERRRLAPGLRRRGWLVRRALLTADVVGLTVAFVIAEQVFGGGLSRSGHLGAPGEYLLFFLFLPAWVVAAKLYGLYDRDEERTDHSTTDEFAGVFHLITVITWVLLAVSRVTPVKPEIQKLLVFWICAVCAVSFARGAGRAFCRRRIQYLQNTAIVGAGDVGQMIARKFLQHPEYGINVVGFVDAQPREQAPDLEHLALLGSPGDLPELVELLDVERVVIAFSNESHTDTLALIHDLKGLGVQIDIMPRFFESVGPNVGLHMIEGLPLVGLPPKQLSRSSALLKRAVDVCIGGLTLALVGPVLLLLAALVRLDSPGPALYRHVRVGRKGSRIEVLKFRTMRIEACRGDRYGGDSAEEMFHGLMSDPDRAREFGDTYKFRDDPRVTRVGRVLRRLSLDELPQLLNVVRGELSLVGPRAITRDELPRYGDRADDLLTMRPGVTGYWQINGRSALSYDDRVRLDLAYINGWTLKLDFEILGKTLRALASQRGAS
jgi:exopolysaccharide biosynthesis polyprenyl glycosylphosphotransferase